MAVIFVCLFLVMAGFGIIIPVLPFFVVHLHGSPTSLGFLMALYSLMQFFFAPVWGRLSDRIGRRPVLLIGMSGYAITFILFGLSSRLWMLFAVRMLSGMVSSATLPTAMAYVADITREKDRAGGMGMVGAAMGLGMIFGPALGGLLGHHGFSLPFFAAGGLALITLPFTLVLLPESLKEPLQQLPGDRRRLSPDVIHNPHFSLFIMSFAVSFSMSIFESTFALFAAARVGFGPKEMGLLFAVAGVLGVIVQAGLVGKLVNKFGDANMIIVGIIFSAAGLLLILTAGNTVLLVVCTGVFIVGNSILRPSVPSLLTKSTGGGKGVSVGYLQSFDSLGRVLGPVTGGLIYEIYIGLPYMLGAGVLLLVTLIIRARLYGYTTSVRMDSKV